MLKKYFSFFLILVLLLGLIPQRILAEEDTGTPHAPASLTESLATGRLGLSHGDYETAVTKQSGTRKADQPVPAVYSSVTEGRVPSTAKDQGHYGTCWAFSTTTVAEATYRQNEGLPPGEFRSLSVLQEAAFCYEAGNDPMGNTDGDANELTFPAGETPNVLDFGGFDDFTMISLSQWDNGAWNETLPYTEPYLTLAGNGTLDPKYNYDYDEARVTDMYMVNTGELSFADRISTMKQLVLDYGAAVLSFYIDNTVIVGEGEEARVRTLWNYTYGSCFCPTKLDANHSVVLVGWNDDYPATNFGDGVNDIPEGNGAWLIQNSWGTNYAGNTSSDATRTGKATDRQGYLWISYYDLSIDTLLSLPIARSADRYQHVYMYDGTIAPKGAVTLEAGESAGAVYQIRGLTSDNEKVEGISFITSSANLTVDVTVIGGSDKEDPLKTEGCTVVTKRVTVRYPGLHTVPIDGPVLAKGEYYTILLTLPYGGSIQIDREYLDEEAGLKCTPDFTNDLTFEQAAGQTEISYCTDRTYRIKGFTSDYRCDIRTQSRLLGTDTSLVPVSGGNDFTIGQTLTLTAPEAPEGYTFLGWYREYSANAPGALLCEDREYPLTTTAADAGQTFTAVYTASEDLTVPVTVQSGTTRISVDGGGGLMVTGETTVMVKAGSEVALTYADHETDFLYWADAEGHVLTRDRVYRTEAVRALTVYAVTAADRADGSTACGFVVFTDTEGHIISGKLYFDKETIAFPDLPAAAAGWDTDEETVQEQIRLAGNAVVKAVQ